MVEPVGATYPADMAPSPLRILIADDFEPVRRRLVELLSGLPGVDIVGEASTVAATRFAIEALSPDVVTLDMSFPDGNGLAVLGHCATLRQRPHFIVLTNQIGADYQQAALRSGACAFLNKTLEFGTAAALILELAKAAAQDHTIVQVSQGSRPSAGGQR